MNSEKLFTIHKYIMIITFYILLPIGITIAIFRSKIGQNWYTYHKHTMLTVLLFAFIGIFISLYAKDSEGEKNIHPLSTIHGIVGTILVVLLLLNVGWAIIVRRYVKDEGSWLTRRMWLNGHRVFGSLIVIILVYNLYLGNKIYNKRFLNK
jgi:cytochrome b561